MRTFLQRLLKPFGFNQLKSDTWRYFRVFFVLKSSQNLSFFGHIRRIFYKGGIFADLYGSTFLFFNRLIKISVFLKFFIWNSRVQRRSYATGVPATYQVRSDVF